VVFLKNHIFKNNPKFKNPSGTSSLLVGKAGDYVYRAPGLLAPTPVGHQHSSSPTATPHSTTIPIMPPDCDCRTIPLDQQHFTYAGGPQSSPPATLQMVSPAFLNSRQRKRLLRATVSGYSVGRGSRSGGWKQYCCGRMSPSKIDRCSRSLFPLLFILFNFLYWSVLNYVSHSEGSDREAFVYFNDQ